MANMNFEFTTASQIIFGPGSLAKIGFQAVKYGKHGLVVTGGNPSRADRLLDILRECNIKVWVYPVGAEPDIETVELGVELARQQHCDMVIGMGGGSPMDAAKAIAAAATNPGDLYDYLEVIGKGMPITVQPLPCIAVPTTAGTGSEVTRNAVLGVRDKGIKVSMRSPMMLPRLALVDPELTLELPPDITAQTGLDALTQLIEPYVSARANPLTDAICQEGMRRAAGAIRSAYANGSDLSARQEMSLSSLFSGLALANAGLGAVHGFAGVIGGMYSAPHGAICARLLPEVMALNIMALNEREPDNSILKKYNQVAQIITGDPAANVNDGVMWMRALCDELIIPRLGHFGLQAAHITDIARKAQNTSSMKGNPIQLTLDELAIILSRSL